MLADASRVRKSLRLSRYDYSSNGMYFITVCTWKRRPILTGAREMIVKNELSSLPTRFAGVTVDVSVVMPDHLHLILQLLECKSTVSAVMPAFKSRTTRFFRQTDLAGRVWQRGFHDRIVRDERELETIRTYIQHNPIVHQERIGP